MREPSLEERIAMTERPAGSRQVMWQEWKELLFLHWEYDPAAIQETLPPGLHVDTFEGKAYLAVVPFYMCGVAPVFSPRLPWARNFLEMNVRTYVHDGNGRAGVWFYSLEANNALAVQVANRLFHLPYFRAEMSAHSPRVPLHKDNELTKPALGSDGAVSYQSRRKKLDSGAKPRIASYHYEGQGDAEVSTPGTLNWFLAERYLLFAHNAQRKKLYTGRVHHESYRLEEAEVEQFSTVPLVQAGFAEPSDPPCSALYCSGVKVRLYPLNSLGRGYGTRI